MGGGCVGLRSSVAEVQCADEPRTARIAPPGPRHYKGGEYEVLAVARHSETLEVVVVYRPLYNDSGWWVRPYEMFTGSLEVDGTMRQRFEYIG
jgi:hypothetical protein